MAEKIFITGASGCIGHYLVERLIQETDYELYLLVRNPQKLKFDDKSRPGIHILEGDLREIHRFSDLLKTVNVAILIATAWGGTQEVLEINIKSNLELLQNLNPQVCQQVIYFSTASLLDRHNQLLPEAGKIGTDYIRTKSECLREILALSSGFPALRVVFPTLVLGGDANKPYSHLSSGLPEVLKWINLIRWFKADGSFHFLHGVDIAKVIHYLVDHPPQSQEVEQIILGNPSLTLNQAIAETCRFLHKKIYWQFDLSPGLTNLFIALFRVQMADWDRFCLGYRHFTYQNTVNPSTFGIPTTYPTLTEILKFYCQKD